LKQKTYMGTKSKSTKWHLIVILTCGIAMPRGTNDATCHTQGLDMWHSFFKKNLKKLKKNQKNNRLTRGTLTNGVSQLCLKGT